MIVRVLERERERHTVCRMWKQVGGPLGTSIPPARRRRKDNERETCREEKKKRRRKRGRKGGDLEKSDLSLEHEKAGGVAALAVQIRVVWGGLGGGRQGGMAMTMGSHERKGKERKGDYLLFSNTTSDIQEKEQWHWRE